MSKGKEAKENSRKRYGMLALTWIVFAVIVSLVRESYGWTMVLSLGIAVTVYMEDWFAWQKWERRGKR